MNSIASFLFFAPRDHQRVRNEKSLIEMEIDWRTTLLWVVQAAIPRHARRDIAIDQNLRRLRAAGPPEDVGFDTIETLQGAIDVERVQLVELGAICHQRYFHHLVRLLPHPTLSAEPLQIP